MRIVAPFAASAAMAVAVSAAPASASAGLVTVPLTTSNNVQSMEGLIQHGKARLAHFNRQGESGHFQEDDTSDSSPITNEGVTYLANVTIGGKAYSLIVDTGSSNLWCGAGSSCEPSKTGKSTHKKFQVSYGSGHVVGTEFLDTVSFAGLTVNKQSLGSAEKSKGFGHGIDGILGLGPVDLTARTVKGAQSVPTFMDNLYSQKSISSEVLGVSLAPLTGSETEANNGELTLGGTDRTKYTGSITYIPKLTTSVASKYWGLQLTGLSVGSKALSLAGHVNSIVDTGTTLIYLPTTTLEDLAQATGGKVSSTGLLSYTKAPTATITLELGGKPFTLTPQQYLVPQSEYSALQLPKGQSYAFFTQGGITGVQVIIGQKFLENYYSVFDTTQQRIGFATRA